jgi:PERQ amino acid-rich with GYF domain-containing protein
LLKVFFSHLGPFTTEQMQEWYLKNFFSDDLPIKREKDVTFEALSRYFLRYGRERPFHAAEEESRQLNRMDVSRGPGYNRYTTDLTGAGGLGGFGSFGFNAGLGNPLPAQGFGMNFGAGAAIGTDPYLGRRDLGFGGMDGTTGHFGTGWGETHGLGRPGWSPLPTEPSTYGGRFGGQGIAGQYRDPLGAGGLLGGLMGQSQVGIPPVQDTHAFGAFGTTPLATNSLLTSTATQQQASSILGLVNNNQTSAAQHETWTAPSAGNQEQTTTAATSAFVDESQTLITDTVTKLVEESSPVKTSPPESVLTSIKPTTEAPKAEAPKSPAKALEAEATKLISKLNLSEAAPSTSPVSKPVSPKKAETAVPASNAPIAEATPIPAPAAPSASKAKKSKKDEKPPTKETKETAAPKLTAETKVMEAKRPQEETQASPQEESPSTPRKPVWSTETAATAPKLSLKEIQEMEERQRKELEKEKLKRAREQVLAEAQAIAEQEAASNNNWNAAASGGVWGAVPKPVVKSKSTLADIMQEEERRKNIEAERVAASAANAAAAAASVAVGGVKRYADSITTAAGATWGAATNAAAGRPPAAVASRPVAVVATGPTTKVTAPAAPATGSAASVRIGHHLQNQPLLICHKIVG